VTLRGIRLLLLGAGSVAAFGLSACGRRGPLELPPEVQARGAALKAEQDTARAKNATKPVPGAADPEAAPVRIPGTMGNRPPDQYPFPLDPML